MYVVDIVHLCGIGLLINFLSIKFLHFIILHTVIITFKAPRHCSGVRCLSLSLLRSQVPVPVIAQESGAWEQRIYSKVCLWSI